MKSDWLMIYMSKWCNVHGVEPRMPFVLSSTDTIIKDVVYRYDNTTFIVTLLHNNQVIELNGKTRNIYFKQYVNKDDKKIFEINLSIRLNKELLLQEYNIVLNQDMLFLLTQTDDVFFNLTLSCF